MVATRRPTRPARRSPSTGRSRRRRPARRRRAGVQRDGGIRPSSLYAGTSAAAVKFAPELKRPLRHHRRTAAARAAVVEADNEASVGSSWDWACRAMSAWTHPWCNVRCRRMCRRPPRPRPAAWAGDAGVDPNDAPPAAPPSASPAVQVPTVSASSEKGPL